MSRRSFTIWFAIFILLQWFVMASFVGIHSLIEMVLSMIVSAILFSNILGIVIVGFICYENLPDLWCYFFNEDMWLAKHGHGIGTPSFSYDWSWISDAMLLAFAIVVIIHLVLCFKRCKKIGISGWWILVPLYNPIMLLYKKSKADSEETVQN